MFSTLLPIIAPIFICAGIGWTWARWGGGFDTAAVTPMVTYIGAPCLVFSSLVGLSVSGQALADMALASAASLAAFGLIGAIALKLSRLSLATYLPPLTFTNCGNMGLPLCLFAFGQAGLELAVVFFAVSMMGMVFFGIWIVSGRASPLHTLKTPLPYAVLAAVALRIVDIEPPAWLSNTTELLGNMTIPLMLITLGVALAKLKITRFGPALALSALRLGMGVGVGLALATLFGLTGTARGVFIIQCTMPAAVFNYLFADLYRREPGEVAGIIVLSTLISFLTLPLLMQLALDFDGV